VIGGLEAQHATPRVEGYDPVTDAWHPGVDLPVPLHHATAVTYRNEIVVIGGWEPDGTDISATTSDRVWALRGRRWVELPSLNHPRAAAAAVVVGDKIVVVGGQADGETVKATEVFDGTRWVDAAPIPTPREHLAAATDGRFVYAVGGREMSSDRNVAALERFDPETGRWDALPPMPTARGGLAATIVDGRLFAVGGEHPTGVFEHVEVYDLASASWSRLPSLAVPRHGLGLVAIDRTVYAVNGATQPTHAESSAALEALAM
jgi:non-specific serine/threonine protein kinase